MNVYVRVRMRSGHLTLALVNFSGFALKNKLINQRKKST